MSRLWYPPQITKKPRDNTPKSRLRLHARTHRTHSNGSLVATVTEQSDEALLTPTLPPGVANEPVLLASREETAIIQEIRTRPNLKLQSTVPSPFVFA